MSLRGFFKELRRRHVLKVAVAYTGIGIVLLEVLTHLFHNFEAPHWVLKVITTLLIVGLPVACLMAWGLEFKEGGVRSVPREPKATKPALPPPQTSVAPSIAVLPFADMSAEHDQQYLGDGIAEELLNALAAIEGLNVAARTSSFSFAGKGASMEEIGRTLHVAHVLEGSVRRSGQRLRVTAQLIDVQSGFHRFSQSYDREVQDIFAIQNDIAREIATALLPKLGLESQLLPGSSAGDVATIRIDHGTQNAEAYNAYLKGRFYWASRYAVGLEHSIECFAEAAKLDPGYAQPLSGLADAYSLLAFYNFMAPRDGFGKSGGLARHAQQLAPQLAETNASLAFVQHFFEWNFGAAETGYRRALQADPNYGPARFWFAFLLATIGRAEDARAEIAAARKAEPFSSIITGGASYLDYFLRDHALGLRTASATLEADPNFGPAHMFLGFHYIATGRYEQAVKCWRAAVERLDRLLIARMMLATAHARAGDPSQARNILQQLDNSAQGYVSPYFRAIAALSLGEREVALDLLEKALTDRNSFLVLSGLEPLLTELHDEPRFRRIVEQVGVPLGLTASPALSA